MKLICKKCDSPIEGTNINISQGVCQCPSCNEVFKIASFLSSDETVRRLPKPVFTKITIVDNYGETRITIPKKGITGLSIFLLFFTSFLIVMTWAFLMNSDVPWWFKFIFVSIGVGTAFGALTSIYLKVTLILASQKVKIVKDLLGFRIVKNRSLNDLEEITQVVMYTQNYQPVYGIGLIFSEKSDLKFGSGLKESERLWLIGEIYKLKYKYTLKR